MFSQHRYSYKECGFIFGGFELCKSTAGRGGGVTPHGNDRDACPPLGVEIADFVLT